MNNLLKETKLLDFSSLNIQELITRKKWISLNEYEKIEQIYNFVRDEIMFGYSVDDQIPSSKVLSDGYGQCNTKGILLMSLLRAVGIPCRLHGFTIKKELQKGVITGVWYRLSPQEIVHSWVEILYQNKWYKLEGFILDQAYLNSLQNKFSWCTGYFCGYGVGTSSFEKPEIYWNECDTYIQKEGIVQDLGIFNTPDDFFKNHKQRLNSFKQFIFRNITRHSMNKNVTRIRKH